MFISGGLATQLARLREQRLAAPGLPLLVACQGLRDLDQVLALEMGADDVVDTAPAPPVVAEQLRQHHVLVEAVSPMIWSSAAVNGIVLRYAGWPLPLVLQTIGEIARVLAQGLAQRQPAAAG